MIVNCTYSFLLKHGANRSIVLCSITGPEKANKKWYSYLAEKVCNLRSSGSVHIAFHDQLTSDRVFPNDR